MQFLYLRVFSLNSSTAGAFGFCSTFQAIDLPFLYGSAPSPVQCNRFSTLYTLNPLLPPPQKSSPFSEKESYYAPALF